MVYLNLISVDESQSPYAHIIHTNYVPPDFELHEIKAFLSKPEAELRRLETEVTRVQAILDGLVSERDKLKHFVDVHKALLSPVRRLPPEILQEIFVRCLSTSRNSVMHCSEAPMLLTEICVEWRRIALSTPTLWSTLHLPFSGPIGSEETQSVRFDVAEAWLTRSGELPLSISVYDMNRTICRPTFLDLLVPFLHRCRRLKLSVYKPEVDQLNALVLPLLEEITISDWHPVIDSPASAYAFLQDITSLKKATVLGSYDLEPALHLPLTHLEVLHLHCWAMFPTIPMQALTILKDCRKLRVVSLSFDSTRHAFNSIDALGNEPIIIPLLHSFYILADDCLLKWMLESLVLPDIRVLGVSRNRSHGNAIFANDQFPAQLKSFLDRASHPIETFVFHPLSISHANLVACLSFVPGITDLELNSYPEYWPKDQDEDDGAILRSLTQTSDNPECLCPNSQRITLKYCSGLFGEEVVDLIRSRWQSVPPGTARLTYANITFDQYLDPTIVSRFDAFRKEGLDISVVSPPPSTPESMAPWHGLAPDSIAQMDTHWTKRLGFLE